MVIRLQDVAVGSPFWYKRLSEISLLFSLIIIGLFGLGLIKGEGLEPGLRVPTIIAIFAGLNAVVAALSLVFSNKNTSVYWGAGSYAILAIWVGALVYASGGVYSPFVSFWMLVGAFSGLFGLAGIIPLALAANAYITWQFLMTTSQLTDTRLILFALAANLPLIVSYIVWHKKSKAEARKEGEVTLLTKKLNEESYKADIVINSIADGVIVIDTQGIIQLINPAAENLVGWAATDATGLHYESVVKLADKRDQPLVSGKNPLERVKISKQPIVDNELTLLSKANKKMIVSLVVSPILEGRFVTALIVVFRDITAEKAREREQAEFISTASHEMRTPVAAIEGYLGLVANPQTATIDDKARDYLEKAQEAVRHLGQLFQDLLTVSRADDSRIESHPEIIDIVKYVGDITEGLLPKAKEKNLTLEFKPYNTAASNDVSRTLTPIFFSNVDRGHLREIVANLIENAIKYTKQGTVVVDVNGDERLVRIDIKDSGIGIAREDLSHLFQKFYRVDNSDTREIGGTGLGLYICRRLAEAMGGSLTVESEQGRGSVFTLVLQRVTASQVENMQQANEIAALQRQNSESILPDKTIPVAATDPVNIPPADNRTPETPTSDTERAAINIPRR